MLQAFARAEKKLKPNWKELFKDVYADMPQHLRWVSLVSQLLFGFWVQQMLLSFKLSNLFDVVERSFEINKKFRIFFFDRFFIFSEAIIPFLMLFLSQ